MTRQSSKQRGISLVEVVLTLGISSLLIGTVLTGRNSIRSQAQFSDGMERIKEQVLAVKSDASTGKNTFGSGTTNINVQGAGALLLGASIRFNTAANTTMQTANIMCYTMSTTNLTCNSRLTTQEAVKKDISTPWQIRYLGYTNGTTDTPINGDLTLAFTRDDTTGSFNGVWYPGVIEKDDRVADVFNDARRGQITLHFASPDGRKANIIVNPSTGAVTRQML